MSDLERRQAQLDAATAERGVGVEELESNEETSLIGQVSNEVDIASRLERAMDSQMPTDRAGRAGQPSSWDTANPTMRPIRRDED